MKKIKTKVRNCDRIVINKKNQYINLYYIDSNSKVNERVYLYTLKASPSVENYFGNRGRTIEDIYRFRRWDNFKLSNLIERLPGIIDSALNEYCPMECYVDYCYER